MAPIYRPIEYYTTKLYERGNSTKRFLELSNEELAELSKKIYKKQETTGETTSSYSKKSSQLERYQSTLEYLTNPLIHLTLKTFDEKVAYLIMATDPNLVIYKEYLKANILSLNEISKVEDEKVRERLRQERAQAIVNYEVAVRDQIGFYDPKLLKYEEMYFNKYFSDRELITEVGKNNQDFLLYKSKFLKNFDSISDERFEELKEIAQYCISMADDKYSISAAAYNVQNQKKMLGINGIAEQLALLILLADSELDMLRIYEEESMIKNVEERIKEQFGYFDFQLLILEKLFHNRFCPEKELTVWSK